MYKFWIKTVVLYPKMYIWFLLKHFTKKNKFWIKTLVLYPEMYIWSRKTKKICPFYSKNEVFAKKFTKRFKFWIKSVVLYPKMYIWS